MAKVKFSALISEMRNKLNGSVFSKNRSGNYLRNKVTPVNPQSAAQTARRSVLTYLSQNWRALSAAQRTAWSNAVANFQTTDVFGDLKTPSGLNLYQRLNGNLASASQAYISTPPAPTAVAAIAFDSLVSDVSSSTVEIDTGEAAVPAGHTLIVEATPQVSPGKNFVKSEYRQISAEAAAVTYPINVFTAYTARFGALTAGQKLFVRLKYVNNTTGLVSQTVAESAIITA